MINWLEKNRKISFVFVLLITLEIFYFSSITGGPGGGSVWIPRTYHFIVFFLFSFFLFITIKGEKEIKFSHLLIVLIISVAHGILDEVHQIFVPLREVSMRDVLTDSLGIFSSIILYSWISKK